MKINARAHSDDYRIEIDFDAYEYFENARDEEIVALAGIGYGGDYEADAVAQYYCDSACKSLFAYLDLYPRSMTGERIGYEVEVEEADVLAYVQQQRPYLFEKIA